MKANTAAADQFQLIPEEMMPFNLSGERLPAEKPPCSFCKGTGYAAEGSYWNHYPLTEKTLPCPYCTTGKDSQRRRKILSKGLCLIP